MRYFRAKEAQYAQDAAFRLYIGTGVQFAVEHLAHLAGGGNILVSYAEVMGIKPKDTRTGDEIAADVIARAGLVMQ